MSPWLAVVLLGAACGLTVGLVQAASSTNLDDPHLGRARVRRAVAEHRALRRLARLVPRRPGVALAEAVAVSAVLVVVAAAATGVLLIMIRADLGLARADAPIAEWAAENSTERSTTIMRALTRFGGTAYVVVAAVAVALYGWLHDRRRAVVVFVVVTMIGQFLVSNSIKWSVDRARPTLSNLTGYSGTSFPSGHAVAAAAAWACVAFLVGRGRGRASRAVLMGAAVCVAVVVAGTRVALGVHWTTDVMAGLAIGWSWFAVCAVLFGGRRLRMAQPVEAARTDARSPSA